MSLPLHIFLLLDWLLAVGWLLMVLMWQHHLRGVPDLTMDRYRNATAKLPRLSVIVPAKNEAAGIAATLRSLQASEGVNLQIVAVDDRSTDQTGSIMDDLASEADSRLRVLHITELPPGWLGKTHAMALAAEQSNGEWLLFTDGDIVFHPDALRRALGFAIASGADHMVVLPTVILRSAGERMMIAFLQVLSIWALRLWRVPDPTAKRDAIGIGAFNMIRREVYDQLGGWASLRMEVVEDVALGRRVKANGYAQRVALGIDLVRVRWAQGAFGVVDNLTKNLFALCRFRPEVLLGGAAALAGGTLFPLALCLVAPAACWPLGILLIALFLAYRRTGRYHHFSAAQMLLYPVASALLIYALLRSMFLAIVRRGIYWRGTFYSLAELRRNQRDG